MARRGGPPEKSRGARRGGAGRVRIVAGEFGGRYIKSPPGSGTRPTMAQVREAVFSILGPMDGWVCADLFAGTGAYGFEALSRGAARVEAFEANRAVSQLLSDNAAALLGDDPDNRFKLHVGRLPNALRRAMHGPYDLVFADPPWGKGFGPIVATALLAKDLADPRPPLVTPATRLVVEESASVAVAGLGWIDAGWRVTDERRYGEASITVLTPR